MSATHILLVEDADDIARAYMAWLWSAGTYVLASATTLAEARTQLQQWDAQGIHCALILLDLNLPDSMGLAGIVNLRQFVREISDGDHPVPIIVLTGVVEEVLRQEVLSWGIKDYRVKALCSMSMLRDIVLEVLEKHGDTDPPPDA